VRPANLVLLARGSLAHQQHRMALPVKAAWIDVNIHQAQDSEVLGKRLPKVEIQH